MLIVKKEKNKIKIGLSSKKDFLVEAAEINPSLKGHPIILTLLNLNLTN